MPDPTQVNARRAEVADVPDAPTRPTRRSRRCRRATVFDAVRARPEAPVVIINHPRGGANYFGYVGYDPATGLASSAADWDTKFTLVEVFNDSGWQATADAQRRDWFGLLRAGPQGVRGRLVGLARHRRLAGRLPAHVHRARHRRSARSSRRTWCATRSPPATRRSRRHLRHREARHRRPGRHRRPARARRMRSTSRSRPRRGSTSTRSSRRRRHDGRHDPGDAGDADPHEPGDPLARPDPGARCGRPAASS